AGGAYVPIDPSYPTRRLRLLIEDSAPRVVIAGTSISDWVSAVDGLDIEVVRLTDDTISSIGGSEIDLQLAVVPSSLAYVIYTSGSTGTPKGVMVDHANLFRLFDATGQIYGFSSSDVWTLFHSLAFDFSVWELFGALLHGGRLVVVPPEIARAPDAFYQLVCDEAITILNQTPSAFRALSVAQAAANRSHRLRWVIFGGEALDLSSLKSWFSLSNAHAGTRLANMYGITETTVHVTYRLIGRHDLQYLESSPIGRPIDDLECHVLDVDGLPVPPLG